jgi:hypothetical protein
VGIGEGLMDRCEKIGENAEMNGLGVCDLIEELLMVLGE